jgi:hypothetical protein
MGRRGRNCYSLAKVSSHYYIGHDTYGIFTRADVNLDTLQKDPERILAYAEATLLHRNQPPTLSP